MEGEYGVRHVRCKLPFVCAVNKRIKCVVEVEPLVGCARFAEECVVLKRLLRVCGEAVCLLLVYGIRRKS
jgi:hypothetical protein